MDEETTDIAESTGPDVYGREFDADGVLVAVNGDDQVKRPAADDRPKAAERVFDADGNLVAGIGDPLPDTADVAYTDPEPLALADDSEPPADPSPESSESASGDAPPAS